MHSTGFTAHLLRASQRYRNRLGHQFAGSITFFSVLAMVPILMFAFGALGWTLTVIRPQWLDFVKEVIARNLAEGALRDQVIGLLDLYLYNWRAISLFAGIAALYAGAGWTANLKGAIRGLWRPEFDLREKRHSMPVEFIINVGLLISLLVLAGVALVANAISTNLAADLVNLVGLDNTFINSGAIRALSLAINLASAWGIFAFLYWVLPEEKVAPLAIARGSLIAAILFYFLQRATTFLSGMLDDIFGRTLFGPILLSMLFLSLFARLILIMAAWIATSNQPAVARRYHPADLVLKDADDVVSVEGHWEAAERDLQRRLESPDEEELSGPMPDAPSQAADDLAAELSAQTDAVTAANEAVADERRALERIRDALVRTRDEERAGLGIGLAVGAFLGAVVTSALRAQGKAGPCLRSSRRTTAA